MNDKLQMENWDILDNTNYLQENEKLEQCIRDLKMSAAEMSEKNLVLENEICKLKERPQLLVSENSTYFIFNLLN